MCIYCMKTECVDGLDCGERFGLVGKTPIFKQEVVSSNPARGGAFFGSTKTILCYLFISRLLFVKS